MHVKKRHKICWDAKVIPNAMEQIPSTEAYNLLANQEISRILWNPIVHYRVHRSPPLPLSAAALFQYKTSHHLSLRSVLIQYSHLCSGVPSGLFASSFPIKMYAFLNSPMRATCHCRHNFLYSISLTIFYEEHNHELHCIIFSSCFYNLPVFSVFITTGM
jgi:hypothetical protein